MAWVVGRIEVRVVSQYSSHRETVQVRPAYCSCDSVSAEVRACRAEAKVGNPPRLTWLRFPPKSRM
jgi:hypothetical protein